MKNIVFCLVLLLLCTSCSSGRSSLPPYVFEGKISNNNNSGLFRFWVIVRMHKEGFRNSEYLAYYDMLALVIAFDSEPASPATGLDFYAVPLSGRGMETLAGEFRLDDYNLSLKNSLNTEELRILYADCEGDFLGLDRIWFSSLSSAPSQTMPIEITGVSLNSDFLNANDAGLSTSTFSGINVVPISSDMKNSNDIISSYIFESVISSFAFHSDIALTDIDLLDPWNGLSDKD